MIYEKSSLAFPQLKNTGAVWTNDLTLFSKALAGRIERLSSALDSETDTLCQHQLERELARAREKHRDIEDTLFRVATWTETLVNRKA